MGRRLQSSRPLSSSPRLPTNRSGNHEGLAKRRFCAQSGHRGGPEGRFPLEPPFRLQEAATRQRLGALPRLPRRCPAADWRRSERTRSGWRVRPRQRPRRLGPAARAASRPERRRTGAGLPGLGRVARGKDQDGTTRGCIRQRARPRQADPARSCRVEPVHRSDRVLDEPDPQNAGRRAALDRVAARCALFSCLLQGSKLLMHRGIQNLKPRSPRSAPS